MQVRRAAGSLDAFVEGVPLAEARRSRTLFAEVRAALLEHEVLFIRDQGMTLVEYQQVARRFGAERTGIDVRTLPAAAPGTATPPPSSARWADPPSPLEQVDDRWKRAYSPLQRTDT